MSKGSNRRPTDEDTYKANYDSIFSKKSDQLELPLTPCKHPVWGHDYSTNEYFCVDCGQRAKHPSEHSGIA